MWGFIRCAVNNVMQYVQAILFISLVASQIELIVTLSCGKRPAIKHITTHRLANPVNADGSNYHRVANEEEAFLWFDEAILNLRAGSGGTGSNTHRYGKSRQHLGKS